MLMVKKYYKEQYDWCSNRLKDLNNKRLENLNKKPPVFDKQIIAETVRLTYKQGLLESALNNPSNEWSLHDHLLYHFDDDKDGEWEMDSEDERWYGCY